MPQLRKYLRWSPLLLALVWLPALNAETLKLGKIDFPTSGSPEAQEHFIRGVLYLHSFEYSDAREAFRQAQEVEPDFAMAYWGEAMGYNLPIWSKEDPESAREALERLAPTMEARLAKAPTEREKDYLRAVEILFGEGDQMTRNVAYADAMERMRDDYPEDLEAAAFYSLALLGTCHDGRHVPTYMKAAAVAEEVFSKNPEHPGAAHYLIHSYDDPVHAPLGLRAARVYAKIAPSADHALHMPSHIFLALGMWAETAAANEESWKAKEVLIERRGLEKKKRNYHALWWKQYAYLQQGRYAEARELLKIMEEDTREIGTRKTRTHFSQMRAAYVIETDSWDLVPEEIDIDFDRLSVTTPATELSLRGFAAVREGRLEHAEKLLAEIRERREAVLAEAREETPDASPETFQRIGLERTREAQIMELELEALIAAARGQADRALTLVEAATEIEKDIPATFGPPIPPLPSFELLGKLLLDSGRYADAMQQFRVALQRTPRRAKPLLGLARAAGRAGDMRVARLTVDTLRDVWSRADAGLIQQADAVLQPARELRADVDRESRR